MADRTARLVCPNYLEIDRVESTRESSGLTSVARMPEMSAQTTERNRLNRLKGLHEKTCGCKDKEEWQTDGSELKGRWIHHQQWRGKKKSASRNEANRSRVSGAVCEPSATATGVQMYIYIDAE